MYDRTDEKIVAMHGIFEALELHFVQSFCVHILFLSWFILLWFLCSLLGPEEVSACLLDSRFLF